MNPFDPNNLRLSQNFAASGGTKKILTTVPVRKPSKESFIRTHPEQRLTAAVLDLKDDQEVYLINPTLHEELCSEPTYGVRSLVTAITRQNDVFIWPIKMPRPDGKIDAWGESSMIASKIAIDKWIRVSSNMSLAAYEIREAIGNFPEPNWPDLSHEEILRIAFSKFYIDSLDHPVVKRLRGEA